jgi:hypothetical protein
MTSFGAKIAALPVRQLVTFFLGSLGGVVVDLVLFQLLVRAGAAPVLANLISSTVAITITYALVTRYTFPASASVASYLMFFGWYAISIVGFSVAIEALAQSTGWSPFLCKLLSLPFSFAVNFIASRLILGRVKRAPVPAVAPKPRTVEPPVQRSALVRALPLIVAWLALLVAGCLLYFRIHFQSDSVFLEDLSRDLFEFGGDWRDWRLTPAPAYFPDMLLYFAAYFLLPTVPLRIFFVSFIQVIMLGLAAMFVVRYLVIRGRVVAQALAVGVLALVTIVCGHTDVWLYFYSTNNHFAALLFPLLGVGVMISFLRRPRVAPLIWLVVFGIVGQVSTTVYIIVFTVPVIVAVGILWLVCLRFSVGSRLFRRGLLLIAAAVALGALIAIPVNALITPFDQTDGRYGLAGSLFVRGLSALLQVFKYALGGGGVVVLLLSLGLIACIGFLVVAVIRRLVFSFGNGGGRIHAGVSVPRYSIGTDGGATAFALWIAAWSLPASVAGSVVSGGIVDQHGYRYFLFPLMLLALIAVVQLLRTALAPRGWDWRVVGAGALVVLVLASVSLVQARPGADATSSVAAACLQDVRDEGVDLDAGLADYWYGRGVTLSMGDSPEIVAVWGTLDPFYWMSTIGPLEDPARYPRTYNFALVHPNDTGSPWVFNEDNLTLNLPAPDHKFACSPDISIWTWDDDSMDKVVTEHFDNWLANNPR